MREKNRKIVTGCVVVVCVAFLGWLLRDSEFRPTESGTVVLQPAKLLRYGFTLRNTSNAFLEDAEFRVFAPVLETATQKTLEISATHSYELLSDFLGNQVLRFQLSLPPYGMKVVTISAHVAISEGPRAGYVASGGQYLESEKFIELSTPEIQALADILGRDTIMETARASHDWVESEIQDSGYVREDRGAAWALRERRGDCTERMYLFAALARANGIPARTVAGFVINESGVLHAGDYHNWAEFDSGSNWQIADPQLGAFGQEAQGYVAMRIISEGEVSPMGNSHRFLAFHDDVEVSMN